MERLHNRLLIRPASTPHEPSDAELHEGLSGSVNITVVQFGSVVISIPAGASRAAP